MKNEEAEGSTNALITDIQELKDIIENLTSSLARINQKIEVSSVPASISQLNSVENSYPQSFLGFNSA